jgi:drug/metabolite transporter (DMT)-like permease
MALLLALAVVLYTVFNVLISRAAGRVEDSLSVFIYNGLGALLPLVVFAVFKFSSAKELLPTTKAGVVYSLLAGVSIGLFALILMKIFQQGSLGYVMPIVFGGAILLSSVAGWLWFNASINTMQVAGLVLVVTGIVLVGVSKTA